MILLRILLDALLLVAGVLVVVRLAGLDNGFPLVTVMTVFPYVVALALAATGAAALAGWGPEVVAGVLAVVAGTGVLVPRALPGPSPAVAPTGPELTVAVSNLRVGRGAADQVVAAVDELSVDVLVVLELTDAAIERLAAAGLGDRLPHQVLLASRLTSGGGIYSRHPLQARPPSRSRRFGATPRVIVDVPGAGAVELDAVHPLPPTSRAWTQSWAEALAALPPPSDGGPGQPLRLLAGDFNASHDHRLFRALLGLGWVDAADARGAGLRPTFSAVRFGEPVPPVTLDHVLVDPRVGVEAVDLRPIPASDHRLLAARLRLPAP